MFARGLKTKIAFNIAILFFVAMLLINIVTVMTTQRDFIRKEASNGYFVISLLEADLFKSLNFDNDPGIHNSRAQVNSILAEAGIVGALLLGSNNQRIFLETIPSRCGKKCSNAAAKRCRLASKKPIFPVQPGVFSGSNLAI